MAAGAGATVVPGESLSAETGSGTAGAAPAPRDPRTGPSAAAPGRTRNRLLTDAYWTTPRRVRALTGLSLAGLLALAAVAGTVLGGARDSIDTIGHRAAPQAERASDLYFALSDLDAQAANLLLVGAAPADSAERQAVENTYQQRRAQADQDLQQAAEASADDPSGQQAVAAVLGALGQYEALVARSDLEESTAEAQPGKPPADALADYQQATDLLRQRLLPAADQVANSNAAVVDGSYRSQRAALGSGWWWLLIVGLLALTALLALQRTLAVRFRRVVNPPLALATVLTAAGLVYLLSLASGADQHLVVAKSNAYDSVIALSRAKAVAYDSNADESRYLTDPSRAVAYQQSFFDKTQSIVQIDGATLDSYDGRLAPLTAAVLADPAKVGFGGYLGDELRNITFPGEQAAADKVLTSFQTYQADDRKIRSLQAEGELSDAIAFDTGTAPGQSDGDFTVLSNAFDNVIGINQHAFDQAVSAADGDLGTGTTVLGGVLLLLVVGLSVLGVRPRLREYR
ncbi:hypothetical protein ACIGXM_01170 [Kitasatospora sp. NPDC052896]|uniref:hypothetical protein n=1 Tax=Kitasatospora sp. NPDC052896 TaxID=3364061 RepID=UPI0037C8E8BD